MKPFKSDTIQLYIDSLKYKMDILDFSKVALKPSPNIGEGAATKKAQPPRIKSCQSLVRVSDVCGVLLEQLTAAQSGEFYLKHFFNLAGIEHLLIVLTHSGTYHGTLHPVWF